MPLAGIWTAGKVLDKIVEERTVFFHQFFIATPLFLSFAIFICQPFHLIVKTITREAFRELVPPRRERNEAKRNIQHFHLFLQRTKFHRNQYRTRVLPVKSYSISLHRAQRNMHTRLSRTGASFGAEALSIETKRETKSWEFKYGLRDSSQTGELEGTIRACEGLREALWFSRWKVGRSGTFFNSRPLFSARKWRGLASWQGNSRRFTCKLQLVVRGPASPRAFQSLARREQFRGRNLVTEIAMYPAQRGEVALCAKVIKAFVLPSHCCENLLRRSSLRACTRSARNFWSWLPEKRFVPFRLAYNLFFVKDIYFSRFFFLSKKYWRSSRWYQTLVYIYILWKRWCLRYRVFLTI